MEKYLGHVQAWLRALAEDQPNDNTRPSDMLRKTLRIAGVEPLCELCSITTTAMPVCS